MIERLGLKVDQQVATKPSFETIQSFDERIKALVRSTDQQVQEGISTVKESIGEQITSLKILTGKKINEEKQKNSKMRRHFDSVL